MLPYWSKKRSLGYPTNLRLTDLRPPKSTFRPLSSAAFSAVPATIGRPRPSVSWWSCPSSSPRARCFPTLGHRSHVGQWPPTHRIRRRFKRPMASRTSSEGLGHHRHHVTPLGKSLLFICSHDHMPHTTRHIPHTVPRTPRLPVPHHPLPKVHGVPKSRPTSGYPIQRTQASSRRLTRG